MTTPNGSESHDGAETDPIAPIKDAANALNIAQGDLAKAVLAANDLGVTWQMIGDTLGIARGNAYQRFRRRPRPVTAGRPTRGMPPR